MQAADSELNRYSRRKIQIEDASVMELKVYTAISIHEIDVALDGLARVLPIEVARHYNQDNFRKVGL